MLGGVDGRNPCSCKGFLYLPRHPGIVCASKIRFGRMREPDTDLDRERRQRAAAGVRARLRRPHRPRHRRRRLHGLASDRSARPARRPRPRLRARDLERRAQQHRPPAPRGQGALRRPDRPHVGRPAHPGARAGGRPALHLPSRRAGARRGVLASPVRDDHGQHDRHPEPAAVDRRQRPRDREARHRRHVGGVRQRPRSRPAPPRLRRGAAASSCTSARRSTRSRSTRPARSRPTSSR